MAPRQPQRDAATALGIDLGGTQIKLAALAADGTALARRQIATCRGGSGAAPAPFADDARSAAREIAAELGVEFAAIGVSAPGLAARDGRSIAFMPGRLHGLEGLDWGEHLGRPDRVPVVNDAHAALIGEIGCGAARGFDDVIMLTLGTGVGGAIVSGGRLLRGHIGRAGHLGHITTDFRAAGDICGTPGSLEDAIGFCTLGRRCGGRFPSTDALVAAALAGDAEAELVWDESVRALAAGVASLINVLDPEAVVLGGGIANAGAPLFDRLDRYLEEYEWRPGGHRVKVLHAQLGEWAGAYGAAHLARHPTTY